MVHIPQGVIGWTTFFVGLLIVAYRVHGIDAPRSWVEWIERQFTAKRDLQLYGLILVIVSLLLGYFGGPPEGFIGWLFIFSIGVLFLIGSGLILAQNHLRMLVVATAEAEDKMIRITSVIITVLGLLWALAPWFY